LIAHELGNCELCEQIHQEFEEQLTVSNVESHLLAKLSIGLSFESEIRFCAEHFCDLSSGILEKLDIEIASAILSSQSLRIDVEDSLIERLLAAILKDQTQSRFCLLEFVCFEFVSSLQMTKVVSMISESLDLMNEQIWSRLSRRLTSEVNLSSIVGGRSIRGFVGHPYRKESSGFDGIFNYLCEKHRRNVHDAGIVTITTSSCYDNTGSYFGKHFESDIPINHFIRFLLGQEPFPFISFPFPFSFAHLSV
jgi:hypothetical protein